MKKRVFSVRMVEMIPKSIFLGGLGMIGLGVLGVWVLSGNGKENDSEQLSGSEDRSSGENFSSGGDGRRIAGLSRGTGVGRRKMDRNEILEVGKRLRWELNPLRRRAALGQLLEGMNEENAMLVREQIVHFSEESPEFQDFHFAWGAMSGVEAVTMGSDTKEKDMAATMTGWASVDPVGALSWYDALDEDRRKCRDVTFGMLKGLASSDLAFATDFVVGKLGEGNEHAGEMMGVLKDKMLEAEPLPVAAEWAVALPEGTVRDEMLMGVTGEFVKKDPHSAIAWADKIQDGETRRSALIHAGRALMKQNAGEGREWLKGSGLTDDIRSEILE